MSGEGLVFEEGEPGLIGESLAEAQAAAAPGAVAGELERGGAGAAQDEGGAVHAHADRLLDAGGEEAAVGQQAGEPADEVLGEQDQLLVEGDAGLAAGGQVAAGEDPLALLDPGLDGLAAVVEGADAARRPGGGAELGAGDQGRAALGLARRGRGSAAFSAASSSRRARSSATSAAFAPRLASSRRVPRAPGAASRAARAASSSASSRSASAKRAPTASTRRRGAPSTASVSA